jgi:hypothetical protein
MEDKFEIIKEVVRQYRKFNAEGTQLKVQLLPPPDETVTNPVTHFETSMNALFNYALRNADDSDMVGLVIHHEGTGQKDKPIRFSFRRRDQLSSEVIWRLFEKVAQSNSRFNALDPLRIILHYVKMPAGFGRVKTEGRLLEQMAHLKRSIVHVNAETKCLAHALLIATARVDNDPNYISYRRGQKIRAEVDRLLEATGNDLSRGGGIHELESFQQYFHDRYKIIVYTGLRSDSIIYEGQVDAPKRVSLLCDKEKNITM